MNLSCKPSVSPLWHANTAAHGCGEGSPLPRNPKTEMASRKGQFKTLANKNLNQLKQNFRNTEREVTFVLKIWHFNGSQKEQILCNTSNVSRLTSCADKNNRPKHNQRLLV